MRRLFLLLLAILGVVAQPAAAPAQARASHHAAVHHAALPGGCHDEGQAAGHVCVGCAIAPDDLGVPGVLAMAASPARAAAPAPLSGRRDGFDPPPPRAAG